MFDTFVNSMKQRIVVQMLEKLSQQMFINNIVSKITIILTFIGKKSVTNLWC